MLVPKNAIPEPYFTISLVKTSHPKPQANKFLTTILLAFSFTDICKGQVLVVWPQLQPRDCFQNVALHTTWMSTK